MDVDYNLVVAMAKDGSADTRLQFMRTSGLNSSALEHAVPEQLFSTPENPAEGVSAVKALQIANDQGIPIYTIDSSNLASVLPQLNLDDDVIYDIQTAVAYGKQVTVPKSNINFHGWTGCGYIIFDPVTGGGAYLISGGMSGAWFWIWIIAIVITVIALASICILSGVCAALASTISTVLRSAFALASEHINLILGGVFNLMKKPLNTLDLEFYSCVTNTASQHFLIHEIQHIIYPLIPMKHITFTLTFITQLALAMLHMEHIIECYNDPN